LFKFGIPYIYLSKTDSFYFADRLRLFCHMVIVGHLKNKEKNMGNTPLALAHVVG